MEQTQQAAILQSNTTQAEPTDNNYNTENEDINQQIAKELRSCSGWGKFISIAGFVSAAFCLLCATALISVGSEADYEDYGTIESVAMSFTTILSAVIMFIMSVVCVVLGVLLLKSCNRIDIALDNNSRKDFLSGIRNFKLFTIIVGILTIISLFFTLISIISLLITQL